MTDEERKRILFVDDDPKVLESMQRIFFDMDDEWDMEFANSGQEALDFMEIQPFDVVVSDMRMPEMDGAELLSQVKEQYPATVRFILSGFSDKEMILRTVGPADQFLTKPCDPDVVKEAITNALNAQNLVDTKKLRAMVSKMRSLPTLPALYVELKEAIESDRSSFKDIAQIVQCDIAITAKVLQLVNSAFFGLRNRMDNLQTALTYLGLESLKAIILTTDVFSKFSQEEIETFDIEALYQHSVFVSMVARKIMGSVKRDQGLQDIACTAGMLHDVGKLIFIRNMADEYKNVYQRAQEESKPLYEIEREVLGVTHADIGGYLMSTWGLPEEIVNIISLHHSPAEALVDTQSPMAIVFMANILAREDTDLAESDLDSKLEKGVLTKTDLVGQLPEWREITQVMKEAQAQDKEDQEKDTKEQEDNV